MFESVPTTLPINLTGSWLALCSSTCKAKVSYVGSVPYNLVGPGCLLLTALRDASLAGNLV
jgi:hypothetical protein